MSYSTPQLGWVGVSLSNIEDNKTKEIVKNETADESSEDEDEDDIRAINIYLQEDVRDETKNGEKVVAEEKKAEGRRPVLELPGPPRSAYWFFHQQMVASLASEGLADLEQQLEGKWAALAAEQRRVFVALAEGDRARHTREVRQRALAWRN